MDQRKYDNRNDTICAISTAFGMAAIAMIRLSGPGAISTIEKVFKPARRNIRLTDQKGYSMIYGDISDNEGLIDTVVIGLFRAPNSYTGEDVVEISCHGSIYIQQRIMNMLTDCGIRVAEPGEFTLRAFLNRRLDLSQAEAVADLIASTSKASHQLALSQMRGGFSKKIEALRQQLLDFASLIELELDFSEEDI